MRGLGIVAMLAPALAACTTTPGPVGPARPGGGKCDAGQAQAIIGQAATGDLGQRLLDATGAKVLRWAPPRTALTMDFREDRLTVSYDDAMSITQVTCG